MNHSRPRNVSISFMIKTYIGNGDNTASKLVDGEDVVIVATGDGADNRGNLCAIGNIL